MDCELTTLGSLQVRWFVELFSELFVPGLFGLLRADSPEALSKGKAKLDDTLKVSTI